MRVIASLHDGPFGLLALSRYRFAGKREQAIREEWLQPLLVHLGYAGDTLNEIRYEEQLVLREPARRIGSQRVKVDYVPTVLGHDLWIMEAKAPTSERDWQDALSQGWLYATHPEIDVPFMAVADGKRIAAYDLHRTDWDDALVTVDLKDLVTRFSELAEVLGAANVAKAVRRRQLKHLGVAMRAEISTRRLDETVAEVKRMAFEARSAVFENQSRILRDQSQRQQRDLDEALDELGLNLVSALVNDPYNLQGQWRGRALEMLLARPPEQRLDALAELRSAGWVRRGGSEVYRPFWTLRYLLFDTCLHLLEDEVVGAEARRVVREGLRDHLLDFPNDEAARAGHRLERVLPALFYRLQFAAAPDLDRLIREAQMHRSDEQLLRSRLSADRLRIDGALRSAATYWRQLAWDPGVLESSREAALQLLERLPDLPSEADGPAGDPDFSWHLSIDPLLMATLFGSGESIPVGLIDDGIAARLFELAKSDADATRIVAPARALLDRLEVGEVDRNPP